MPNFECDTCQKPHADEYELEIHCINSHKDTHATCKLCGVVLQSMAKHLKHQHPAHYKMAKDIDATMNMVTIGAGLKCRFCGHAFMSRCNLINHINSHAESGDRSYSLDH